MTLPPEPVFRPSPPLPAPWWWQLLDASGAVIEAEEPQRFPTRGDAESWLGEAYAELAEDGVDAVTLHEDERAVYGPMSLHAE